MIDIGLSSHAVRAGLLAVAPFSLPFTLTVIALLLAVAAIVVFSRRRPAPSAIPSEPSSCSEASTSQPASTEQERVTTQAPSRGTPSSPPKGPDDISPSALLDAQSVADALLASAARAGSPVSCSIWRADGASDVPVRVIVSGSATLDLARGDVIGAALGEDTPVLDVLVAESGPDSPVVWRYAIPISLGELQGAAVIDFRQTRPDIQTLQSIATVFRLPVTAALALDVARLESHVVRELLEFARDLPHAADIDVIVSAALDSALRLADASSGSIMLYDDSGADLRIAAARGLPPQVIDRTAARPGDGVAGWVALSGQPLVIEDLPDRPAAAHSRGVRSAVSVPIADEDGVLGVLNVGSRNHPSRFTATHLESLEALARHTASALRNAHRVSSAGELCLDTLKALALAIETKDPYAMGGTDRVMAYAAMLGRAMRLSQEQARSLDIAAMLHDIGMLTVGETAMVSDRPLTTIERGLIKMHPVIAAEIIDQAPALRDVVPIIYHHHEYYDGTGYVGGLAREAIPIGARILTVADAFVAMTSERPYRPAMTQEAALAEIKDKAGTQFDPEVVDAFADLVEEPRQDPVEAHGT